MLARKPAQEHQKTCQALNLTFVTDEQNIDDSVIRIQPDVCSFGKYTKHIPCVFHRISDVACKTLV